MVDDRWATLLPARPWRGWTSLRPGWQLCLAAEILATNGAHQPCGSSPLNKKSILYPAQIGAFIPSDVGSILGDGKGRLGSGAVL